MPFKKILQILLLFQLHHQINCFYFEINSFAKNFTTTSADSKVCFSQPLILGNINLLAHLEYISFKNEIKVTQEAYLLEETQLVLDKKACPIYFAFNENLEFRDADIIQLAANRVIVKLKHLNNTVKDDEAYQYNYYLINMRDCEVHDIGQRMSFIMDPMDHIITYSDGSRFDVFYTDFKLCKQGRARYAYTTGGTPISDPHCVIDYATSTKSELEKIGSDVVPISDKQYFILDVNERFWLGYVVNYDGKKNIDIYRGWKTLELKHRMSTGHDRITLCWVPFKKVDSKVSCTYIKVEDWALRARAYHVLNLKFPYNVLTFDIHNLPKHGFLVLTSSIENKKDVPSKLTKYYDLWRINDDSSFRGKPAKIEGLSCDGSEERLQVFFNEQEDREFCITFQCNYFSDPVRKDDRFMTKCFYMESDIIEPNVIIS